MGPITGGRLGQPGANRFHDLRRLLETKSTYTSTFGDDFTRALREQLVRGVPSEETTSNLTINNNDEAGQYTSGVVKLRI